MAKLSDDQIVAVFTPHLSEGEKITHWAYGIRQPSMLVIVPLFALAILPGAIATAMLTRHYLIGMSATRLIVLRIKGFSNADVTEVTDYSLVDFASAPAATKTGGLFTHIKITDPAKPFRAKFHRAFSKTNRPHAMAIAEAISG